MMIIVRRFAVVVAAILTSMSGLATTPKPETDMQSLWAGVEIQPVYHVNADASSYEMSFVSRISGPQGKASILPSLPASIVGPAIVFHKKAIGACWQYHWAERQQSFVALSGDKRIEIASGGYPWRFLAVESAESWELFFVQVDVVADGSEVVARCSMFSKGTRVATWNMIEYAHDMDEGARRQQLHPTIPALAVLLIKEWRPKMDEGVVDAIPFAPNNNPTLVYRLSLGALFSRLGFREIVTQPLQIQLPVFSNGSCSLIIPFGHIPSAKQSYQWREDVLQLEVKDAWGITLTPFWILRDSGSYYCGHADNLAASWWWTLVKR